MSKGAETSTKWCVQDVHPPLTLRLRRDALYALRFALERLNPLIGY